MADPLDITQLDLQNLPPEQAAALAQAHQRALQQQQQHALVGLLSAMPEAQKMGALEYGQAGREREGGQQTAANVLKTTLEGRHLDIEKLNMERQLAALQQQIEFQRGQLELQGQQLGASIIAPLIPSLLQSQTSEANIRGIAGLIGGHWGKKLADTASTLPEAHQKVIMDFLRSVGLPLGGALNPPTVPRPKGGATHKEPASAPTTEATVAPSAPAKLRVRNKKTGEVGKLSPQFFNDQLYERVPEE